MLFESWSYELFMSRLRRASRGVDVTREAVEQVLGATMRAFERRFSRYSYRSIRKRLESLPRLAERQAEMYWRSGQRSGEGE